MQPADVPPFSPDAMSTLALQGAELKGLAGQYEAAMLKWKKRIDAATKKLRTAINKTADARMDLIGQLAIERKLDPKCFAGLTAKRDQEGCITRSAVWGIDPEGNVLVSH